ncbi:oligosaccharide flippase family protein [Liquorilactobacillus hordei]|uniref:oligosaccharide flippase family protein n=1 Tax=Liquorilactobacillus hordei TaxID=468911 RepID=UPI0039EAC67A
MGKSKFLKDIISVAISNGIILLSGALITIVVPSFTGVSEYGKFKLFSLYVSYTGLLHFGFVDGILLKHSGKSYESIDKKIFRVNSKFFIVFQLCTSSLLFIFLNLFLHKNGFFLNFVISLDALLINFTTYFQFISQATMNFKRISLRNIIQSFLRIAAVILLIFCLSNNFITKLLANYLIGCWVFIDMLLMIWYLYSYRDIVIGASNNFKSSVTYIIDYFKIGIPLTFSYQISTLIYNLDNQFVAAYFNLKVYGIYSFAYSLMTLINTIITAIAIVLLPNLKKMDEATLIRKYNFYMSTIAVLVFGGMIVYFPLKIFISTYLDRYIGSFAFLRIIFPGLALSSCINTIMFVYYQVLGKINIFFKTSIKMFAISIVINFVAVTVFHTPQSISVVSIIILAGWYIETERYFVDKYKINWKSNYIYIILMMICFYLTTSIVNNLLGLVVYTVVYVILGYGYMRKRWLGKDS